MSKNDGYSHERANPLASKLNRTVLTRLALLLLVICALAVFAGWRVMGTLRWGMAECLRWQGEMLAERYILDKEEHSRLNGMVLDFSHRIEAGNVPMLRGFTVLRSFYAGPVSQALLHASIVSRLRMLEAPEGTSSQEVIEVSRIFFLGSKAGKVSPGDADAVQKMLMEQRISETATSIGFILPEQVECFKRNIGLSSLLECQARMHAACNTDAGIGPDAAPDPTQELEALLAAATR